MPFYEIEILLDNLKELNEREEEERKKSEKKESQAMPSLSNYQRQMQQATNFHMPSMPSFKL
jgi:hypothetical protein